MTDSSHDGPESASASVSGSASRSADWIAPAASGVLQAHVRLPGSKSLTNRYLIVAALACEPSVLRAPLRSRDTLLMAAGLRTLGVQIEDSGSPSAPDADDADWLITPPERLVASSPIDCGLAGTVMRFLPAAAAIATGDVVFDGDPQARNRPIGPVIDALRTLGAEVDDNGTGTLPFAVRGKGSLRGGTVTLDASESSQFISALLLAGARYDEGVTVHHDGKPVPSLPHIEMTVEVLRDAGAIIDDGDANTWRVEPSELNGLDVAVEPDLSNAGPFLAAALVAGGSVTVPGWPQRTTQAGDRLRDIFDTMGADVRLERSGLTVTGTGEIGGIDIDLHDASELTPLIASLAAMASSPSVIRGVAHIRGHETDRLAALVTELGRLGANIAETEDGLHIRPAALHTGRFATYHDHRMAMAAAVLGLRVPGLLVEDIATVGKTLPTFTTLWERMVSERA